jgi:hypothetical protein
LHSYFNFTFKTFPKNVKSFAFVDELSDKSTILVTLHLNICLNKIFKLLEFIGSEVKMVGWLRVMIDEGFYKLDVLVILDIFPLSKNRFSFECRDL